MVETLGHHIHLSFPHHEFLWELQVWWMTEEAHQSAASLSESHLFLFDQNVLSIGATLAGRDYI